MHTKPQHLFYGNLLTDDSSSEYNKCTNMLTSNAALEAILQRIKIEIGEAAFALWFSMIQAESLENKMLSISVPSAYFKQSIEKKYFQHLETAAHNIGIQSIIIKVNASMIVNDSSSPLTKNFNETDDAISQAYEKKNVKASEISDSRDTKIKSLQNYTFENFITGPTNEFAASIAVAVGNNPGQAYNPYLVYGSVGLGKTHILKAVGNKILSTNPRAKLLYITSEAFLNLFVEATQSKGMTKFRNKMRTLDVLLIDDVQFFAGKEQTQEELFHIFNVLHSEERQMVFASDRPVSRIQKLEERLASRFQSGTSADLQPPTSEMAIAIMKNELKKNNKAHMISDDILNFIASHVRNNIRDMLSFLRKVVGYNEITKKTVSLDVLKRWVADHKPKSQSTSVEKILKVTAAHFTVGLSDIKSKKRTREITKARKIAIFLLRKHNTLTFTEIGKSLNISHVAANSAYTTIEKEIEINGPLSEHVFAIEATL